MLRTTGLFGLTLLLSSSLCGAQSATDPDLLACAKSPDLAKRIAACTTFIDKTPDQTKKAMALYLRSTAKLRAAKSDAALADINRAIELDGSIMDFHLAKAQILQSAGKLHGAEYIYDAILQKFPNHVPGLLGKTRILAKRDLLEDALEVVNHAVKVAPQKYHVWGMRAYVHSKMKNYDYAEVDAKEAINIDPNKPHAYSRLGFVYIKTGRLADARASLERSRQIAPNREDIKKAFADLEAAEQAAKSKPKTQSKPKAKAKVKVVPDPLAEHLLAQGQQAFAAHRYVKAFKFFEKAARGGNAKAMGNLGYMYLVGRGKEEDHKKAYAWLSKSAENGHAEAMLHLSYMFERGYGVGRDKQKRLHWLIKAADRGFAPAMNRLAGTYERGAFGTPDHTAAAAWYRKAAKAQESGSMYRLAVLYEAGKGVEKDARAAAEWFASAIEHGHEDAIGNLTRKPEAWSKSFRTELQKFLRNQGFYKGKADGVIGPATIRSLKGWAG